MACAAEGKHLYEGIADAVGALAGGFGIGRDDSISIAFAQGRLRGLVVGGEVDSSPAPLFSRGESLFTLLYLFVDGFDEKLKWAFIDGLLVIAATDVNADGMGRE